MIDPMRGFFRLSILYFLIVMGFVWLLRDQPVQFLINTAVTPLVHLGILENFLPWFAAIIVATVIFTRHRINKTYFQALSFALVGSLVLAFAFAAMKPMLPLIVPFFADPFFAKLDRIVHFGVDPWVLVQGASGWIDPDVAQILYFSLWLAPALFFPIFLVLFDDDKRRVARYLFLYLFVFIGLGNILALAGMSAGPIYFERLTGLEDFTGLSRALEANGIARSYVGVLQDGLWDLYVNTAQMKGSGISAFPSVHVGIVAMAAAYAWERHKAIGVLFILYAVAILFLSVYLGWHYAVDGYVSILLVALVAKLGFAIPYPGKTPDIHQ